MKRSTKHHKLEQAYAAYQATKTGQRPKPAAKDGSIPTHPVVPVKDQPEAAVLAECLGWLKKHRIVCWRHDCGTGGIEKDYVVFGIKGSGDIHGLLPNGIHLEVETKAGKGGRLSIAQQKHKEEVESSNGVYLIAHGREELEYYMKGLAE